MQDFGQEQVVTPDKPKFNGTIRPAEKRDLPTLKKVLEMWVRDSETHKVIPEEVKEDLEDIEKGIDGLNDHSYLVAETPDGKVIGMMGLKDPKWEVRKWARTSTPMELFRSYVDEGYRGGKGVGTFLIQGIERIARSLEATEVVLDSGPRYEKTGHGFYVKMGYDKLGVNENYYGKGGHAQVFGKVLT